MAIITAAQWQEYANIQLTDAEELASVALICTLVDKAVKNKLKRTIEQANYTIVVDAPDTPDILLTRYAPITITDPLDVNNNFKCWVNRDADGDPDAFTDDHLLTMYQDYRLDPSPENPRLSMGMLRRNNTVWGMGHRRRPGMLAFQTTPLYGAVKLQFQGGYKTIPEDLLLGVCTLVSMVRSNREHGFLKGSESWGGYNYNLPGVGLMIHGLLGNPDVAGFLLPYINYDEVIG